MEAVAAEKPVIKVVAICGSLRKGSFNRSLLRSAIQISNESIKGMEIEYVDIAPLPMLNTDLEVAGTYPPAVEAFRQKIREADSVLFASPEYNYSISAIHISNESIKGMEIEYVDIGPLPMLNTDLEVAGTFPQAVEAFRQKIREADSVLFASPEYNYSISAPLKNALDWASRPPNVWADKAAAIVSGAGVSSGQKWQYHLRQIGVFLDLHFINKPEFFLNVHQRPAKFDSDGELIDAAIKDKLKQVLLSLQAFTLRLQKGSSVE